MNKPERLLMVDTETTGLNVEEGDRIIEIGIVEYLGLTPTGRTFHHYVNPDGKQIMAGAIAVHGITNDFLADKPLFSEVVDEMLDFIEDGSLVIYNAGFDLGFLNEELKRLNYAPIENVIIDALEIARKRWPRNRNTLDAVAKRLKVDVSGRDLHGALIDATILGNVYRILTQQDELGIAEVASAILSPTTKRAESKPILRAPRIEATAVLRAESCYTIFGSALRPEAIVEHARAMGYDHAAIVDQGTTAGAMAFAEAAKKAGIKGMVGVALDLRITPEHPIVLYARNADGWRNIQRLVTIVNVDNKGEGLTSDQLRNHCHGIAATGGGANGAIAHLLRTSDPEIATKTAKYLAAIFHGAFALEISRNDSPTDSVVEAGITAVAHAIEVPVVATCIARSAPGDDEIVEVLRAIGTGQSYQPDLSDGEHMRSPEELAGLFRDIPAAVENNGWFASLCDFMPTGMKPMLPHYETEEGDEKLALQNLARKGLDERISMLDQDADLDVYEQRYEYEMGLICGQGFAGYFLIVADFITWAREQGIPVGPGRGSGAGSIVAWALGITKLDPIKLRLLFERFINPDRVSLPDFDIDFCEDRREEVIGYVQRKYGREHAVSIGTYGTFGARQSIKDAGRILGLPYGQMDRIAKELPDKGGMTFEDTQSEAVQSLVNTPETREALSIALKISGLVRNKSKHAAGIVISEQPVADIASLEPDPKNPDILVTQYDMKPVEKAGLVKFDFLGLKNLTIIEKCRKNLLEMGIDIDPYALPLDDEKTYRELSQGFTMGVFQLESPGITRACRDIRVDTFEDIVAIVALYRPGPMEYIPLYARRKKGLEPFGTPHPLLDDVARDTYGILIYQEQVMQAAQVLAGYTLGQADLLRRAMGKKIKEEMDAQREVFIKGCLADPRRNIDEQKANDLFEIIEKFASYGFNRSHAAAYALLSYITAYLRVNHSAAYLAAALDGTIKDTEQMVRMAQEARRYGLTLEAPLPDESSRYFKAIDDKTIRWSLSAVRGVGTAVVDIITREAQSRPFSDMTDFISRTSDGINKSQAMQLAAAGAFDSLADGRKNAINLIEGAYNGLANEAKSKRQGQHGLFDDEDMPDIFQSKEIDDKMVLSMERDAIGLTLSAHPLDTYAISLGARGILMPGTAQELIDLMPVTMAVHVDEVKIGKNRNAWMTVRVSDERASFVTGCQEDMPKAEMLQEGALLIIRLSSYTNSGERRLRIDEVVGEVSESGASTVLIEANSAFSRDTLRTLLATSEPGQARLKIVQGEDVVFTPPLFMADETMLDKIRTLDGVDYVGL